MVQSVIIPYFSEMIAFSQDLDRETTVRDITSKGKNLLIYESFRGIYPPE